MNGVRKIDFLKRLVGDEIRMDGLGDVSRGAIECLD